MVKLKRERKRCLGCFGPYTHMYGHEVWAVLRNTASAHTRCIHPSRQPQNGPGYTLIISLGDLPPSLFLVCPPIIPLCRTALLYPQVLQAPGHRALRLLVRLSSGLSKKRREAEGCEGS